MATQPPLADLSLWKGFAAHTSSQNLVSCYAATYTFLGYEPANHKANKTQTSLSRSSNDVPPKWNKWRSLTTQILGVINNWYLTLKPVLWMLLLLRRYKTTAPTTAQETKIPFISRSISSDSHNSWPISQHMSLPSAKSDSSHFLTYDHVRPLSVPGNERLYSNIPLKRVECVNILLQSGSCRGPYVVGVKETQCEVRKTWGN